MPIRRHIKGICIAFILAATAYSTEVSITGKVLNKENIPQQGVVVQLSRYDLTDTTGEDGIYHLSAKTAPATAPLQSTGNTPVLFRGAMLYLNISDPIQPVSITVFDLSGRKMETVLKQPLTKGTYSICPVKSCTNDLPDKMYIVQCRIGNELYCQRVLYIPAHRYQSGLRRLPGNQGGMGKWLQITDTLLFMKNGQMITTTEINDYIDTLPHLFIVQRDMYGNLNGDPKSIGSIRAVITGDLIPEEDPVTAELWFNEPNSSYSGFVYFVATQEMVNYTVTVEIYSKDSVVIGRSLPISFPSTAGNINLPDFSAENAIPQVNAGPDIIVSVNDTIYLHASVVDSFSDTVSRWEWNINGNGFVTTSGSDTVIVAPPDTQAPYNCFVRVTDSDGNSAIDSVTVSVVADIPVADAGDESNVARSSQVTLSGSAGQQFGSIVKWEWSINGGDFAKTSSSDTVIITPAEITDSLVCVLRVTDDDGYSDSDSVVLSVGYWERLVDVATDPDYPVSPCLVFSGDVPHLALIDDAGYIRVTRYENEEWENVGESLARHPPPDGNIDLKIDNGTPYIALCNDYGPDFAVLQFTGTAWQQFDSSGTGSIDRKIVSLAVADDVPYAAFSNASTTGGNRTVFAMKFNGSSWEMIGGENGPAGNLFGPVFLSLIDGIPYIAYDEYITERRIAVKKLSDGAWEYEGDFRIPNDYYSFSFHCTGESPFIAYSNSSTGMLSVRQFTGSTWEFVGDSSIAPVYMTSLSSDMRYQLIQLSDYNGMLCVAFLDPPVFRFLCFNGEEWVPLCRTYPIDENVRYAFAISESGTPWLAVSDQDNEHLEVLRFN